MKNRSGLVKIFSILAAIFVVAIIMLAMIGGVAVSDVRVGATDLLRRVRNVPSQPSPSGYGPAIQLARPDKTWHAPDEWLLEAGMRCGDAPMVIPTDGFVGILRGDLPTGVVEHSGLDIFGPPEGEAVVPVVAANDGYLTRKADWHSTVIIRHPEFSRDVPADGPDDVLGTTLWTYYTHMASADGERSFVVPEFPAGTHDVFVLAGSLVGYQGTWSDDPARPIGLHLHFSIVSSSSESTFADERLVENTWDPLPFLGLAMNEEGGIVCGPEHSTITRPNSPDR